MLLSLVILIELKCEEAIQTLIFFIIEDKFPSHIDLNYFFVPQINKTCFSKEFSFINAICLYIAQKIAIFECQKWSFVCFTNFQIYIGIFS